MSTRSGKRIHSLIETVEDSDIVVPKLERRTRHKAAKENVDTNIIIENKSKKRKNYVTFPVESTDGAVQELGDQVVKRWETLKELATNVTTIEEEIEKKPVRVTRRTKKFEDHEIEIAVPEVTKTRSKKGKKSNKNKAKTSVETAVVVTEPDAVDVVTNETRSSKRKKKAVKRSRSFIVEDVNTDINTNVLSNNLLITSDTSEKTNSTLQLDAIPIDNHAAGPSNTTINKIIEQRISKSLHDKSSDKIEPKLDSTFEKNGSKLNSSFEKNKMNLNCTFERKETKLDSTFEKMELKLNSTFEEKELKVNSTFENMDAKLDSTFENKKLTLESTFEKTESVLDSTFDKKGLPDPTCDKSELQTLQSDSKSSLISSDEGTVNVTFDKSDENSFFSIKSDNSKTENIMNTTPVLIESSMEESRLSNAGNSIINISEETKVEEPKAPQTPLKREGTFTKDGPEITSPGRKTPKRISEPSPGRTPFHSGTKNGVREKSFVLNLTRSIEKPRSSLVEPPRTTRVMFCSPVNNPTVATQRKSKIIKSNLKGSNKSFVFDESVSEPSRPGRRKRSFTHGDADEAGAKRKRLGDDLQQSVNRLSRPRTTSATPTTPSKKTATPGKTTSENKVSRAKLPNFSALHQRRFEKMESLDECQERKAKRAKQLLIPTGSLTVLERSSPKGPVTETVKTASTKPETPTKPKPATEVKPKPAYTRFGFKLNLDVNPFSISKKNTTLQPKENKPNGLLKREATLPSLTGATSIRKEVAKQTIMREKSFTSLSERRDAKRNENRTIIKGVRTNRRFELQMKSRNING